jgi:hypothetical protein
LMSNNPALTAQMIMVIICINENTRTTVRTPRRRTCHASAICPARRGPCRLAEKPAPVALDQFSDVFDGNVVV